jgi:hypothetical protein
MPKSVTASLEALLRAEVATRIAEVKTVTDSVVEQIRSAAGRAIAELEHLADRIAAGEVEIDQEDNGNSSPAAPAVETPVPPQTIAVPPQAPAAAPSSIARATWIPYGAPLPDYAAHGPGAR